MIVNYTDAEKAEREAFEDKYEKIIQECYADLERSQNGKVDREAAKKIYENTLKEPVELRPNPIDFREDGDPIYDPDEWKAYKNTPQYIAYYQSIKNTNQKIEELFFDYESQQSDEWRAAKIRLNKVSEELGQIRENFLEKCEQRQFNELCGDPGRIIDDAKSQITQIIKNRYEEALKAQKEKAVFSSRYLRVDGKKLYIDSDEMMKDSPNILRLHYAFFENDQEATKKLRASLFEAIEDSPYTGSQGILGGIVNDPQKGTRKTYRTRTRAEKADALANIPKNLAAITLSEYQYGMSLHEEGKAHLQKLYTTDGLKFKNGKMYFDDAFMREVSEVELQNMKTKEGIASIDLTFLRAIYSLILHRFEKNGNKLDGKVISFNISDIAEYIGLQANLNKADTQHFIEKMQSYHNIIGVLHKAGQSLPSLYPVLNFEGYNHETKQVSFYSPYMNYVIETVYKTSIMKDSRGIAKKDRNGNLLTAPAYTRLEKGNLAKARNKTAAENIPIIVTLIEQAGNNTPRIKASTLIERNEKFAKGLANDKNPTKYLERVFANTWEYLRKYTDLEQKYKNIQLPDPKDPANIPSTKELETKVFEFPHEGKLKK